jgi:phospholipid transport system transporter-binding protein
MPAEPAAAAAPSGSNGAFRLVASADGRLTAEGPLTFLTARWAHEQGLQSLSSSLAQELEVDCRGITSSDSAGLAVLLDWLGAVKRAGRSLRYRRLPPGLLALGRISEVDELLERGV